MTTKYPFGKGCIYWLVFSTPLKNISQLGWLFPIYGKIKHVPNHQPVYLRFEWILTTNLGLRIIRRTRCKSPRDGPCYVTAAINLPWLGMVFFKPPTYHDFGNSLWNWVYHFETVFQACPASPLLGSIPLHSLQTVLSHRLIPTLSKCGAWTRLIPAIFRDEHPPFEDFWCVDQGHQGFDPQLGCLELAM